MSSHTVLEYNSIDNRWRHLPAPPASAPSSSTSSSNFSRNSIAAAAASHETLKQSRAWDLAISPAKSLPMQAFMLYMSGSGVQIFSIGIVFMLLLSPFKNVAGINNAFAPYSPASNATRPHSLLLQKLAYIGCNLLTLAVGLWKCRSMGLLPMGTGDWLAFETRGPAPEFSLS